MPVFDLACDCGREWEAYLPVRDEVPPCECGGTPQKKWGQTPRTGYSEFPYTTKNLTADGREVEVTSRAHEKLLMEEFTRETGQSIRKRDDAAWIDTEYAGWDFAKGRQIYKEGSGLGLPGSWATIGKDTLEWAQKRLRGE